MKFYQCVTPRKGKVAPGGGGGETCEMQVRKASFYMSENLGKR